MIMIIILKFKNKNNKLFIFKLFSPIVLDQMDNDQCYLEGPLSTELGIETNSQIENFQDSNVQSNTSNGLDSNSVSNNNDRNGKSVGNEFSNYQFISLI